MSELSEYRPGKRKVEVRFPKYTVEWSEEDRGFVATCDWFPSLSWIDADCVKAPIGLTDMLSEEFDDGYFAEHRKLMNGRRGL